MNIEEFREQLIEKYTGTFSEETEKQLKSFEGDYNMLCVNCALYLTQLSSSVTANTFLIFKKVNYTEYKKLYTEKDDFFFSVFDDVLYEIKDGLIEILNSMPSLYMRMTGTEVKINFAAIETLKISEYMSSVNSSYLEVPVLLSKAVLNLFDVVTQLIDGNENDKDKTVKIKILMLSAVLLSAQALYSVLFCFKDDTDEEKS